MSTHRCDTITHNYPPFHWPLTSPTHRHLKLTQKQFRLVPHFVIFFPLSFFFLSPLLPGNQPAVHARTNSRPSSRLSAELDGSQTRQTVPQSDSRPWQNYLIIKSQFRDFSLLVTVRSAVLSTPASLSQVQSVTHPLNSQVQSVTHSLNLSVPN
jgi:hypothetical protein